MGELKVVVRVRNMSIQNWPLWEPTSQGSPHIQTQFQDSSRLTFSWPFFYFSFYFYFFPGFLAISNLLSSNNINYLKVLSRLVEIRSLIWLCLRLVWGKQKKFDSQSSGELWITIDHLCFNLSLWKFFFSCLCKYSKKRWKW